MSGSASIASGNIDYRTPPSNSLSKLKTYGFAATIIIGIIGLGIGTTGLAGYFHVGMLSNISQVDAIIMMAAGGGGGTILLIIGVVGTVKNRQSSSQQQHNNALSSSGNVETSTTSVSTSSVHDSVTGAFDPAKSIYGREAWKQWKNVEIADPVVPPPPVVEFDRKKQALLYIPNKVIVNGKEQNLTLKTLQEIVRSSFVHGIVEGQFGDDLASGGWILIDKTVIPESRGKSYEANQKMVEERECSMPRALEAAILNLMVFAFTGKRLYGANPTTYTYCLEKVDGREPVVVGSFGPYGISVGYSSGNDPFGHKGVACVRRKF